MNLPGATAITASGACQFTLINCTITAERVVDASGMARVTFVSAEYNHIENNEIAVASFTPVAGITDIAPYDFYVIVEPETEFGPCFAEYDIECKINTVSTW